MTQPPPTLCGFYVFGGVYRAGPLSSAAVLRDFWAFDARQQQWLELVKRPPRRFEASLSLREADGALYLFGGVDQSLSQAMGDTWRYDPGSAQWGQVPKAGKGPGPRSGHVACVLDGVGSGGTLLVALGQNVQGGKPVSMYKDAFALDLATQQCGAATPRDDSALPR